MFVAATSVAPNTVTMEKLSILVIAQSYHPVVGGVETHAEQVAHELHRRGHGVAVAAMTFAEAKVPARFGILAHDMLVPNFASYEQDGIPIHSLTPCLFDRLRMAPIAVRALSSLPTVLLSRSAAIRLSVFSLGLSTSVGKTNDRR